MIRPFTEQDMLALAGSAIAKIDRHGRRGTSMVTFDEIEALAALAECLGAGPACQHAHHAHLQRTADAARGQHPTKEHEQ